MQRTQPRRVRARDIHHEVIRHGSEPPHALHEVRSGILRLAVLSEIHADRAASFRLNSGLQTGQDRLVPGRVEAVPVDDRLIVAEAKHARLLVAWLGLRGHRADFYEGKANVVQHGARGLSVLVEARSQADGMSEVEPEHTRDLWAVKPHRRCTREAEIILIFAREYNEIATI